MIKNEGYEETEKVKEEMWESGWRWFREFLLFSILHNFTGVVQSEWKGRISQIEAQSLNPEVTYKI